MAAVLGQERPEAPPKTTILHLLTRIRSKDDEGLEALLAAGRSVFEGASWEQAVWMARHHPDKYRRYSDMWLEVFELQGGFLRYPDLWVFDRLCEWPWSIQRRILRSTFQHRKTAVVSSYGIGKDWTAARAITCWLDQHEPGEAFVVSTAPTFAQVRAILWREVQTAFQKANNVAAANERPTLLDRGHRLNLTEWWIGREMVGFGRKPAATDTAGFQGIHARSVLVVLDEAGGIPEGLFEDAEKLVTTERSRILAIGNPTHEGTYWHRTCNDPDWHVIHVSAFDTPNFTEEPIPDGLRELLTSRLWVDEQRRKYGESSPRYQQQVLGRFSKDRTMTTVPLDWVRAAVQPTRYGPAATRAAERVMIEQGPIVLGVDLASGGSDWTVIRERVGNRAGRQWRTQSSEPKEIVALIQLAALESRPERIVIDSIGIGFGVVELARQATGLPVIAADASEASDVMRLPDGSTALLTQVPPGVEALPVFANKRAEWWWAARERSMLASDPGYRPIVPYVRAWDLTALEFDLISGNQLSEPDETIDELTTPGYSHITRGKTTVILVESKDDLRKAARLGHSTDHADALLMAFVEPPAPEIPAVEYGGTAALRGNNGGQGGRRPALIDRGRGGSRLLGR